MERVYVRFLDSIAGLRDPRAKEELDQKYENMRERNFRQPKPQSPEVMESIIANFKKQERYGEVPLGFRNDWSFKPGERAFINADLAAKWQAAEICEICPDQKEDAA